MNGTERMVILGATAAEIEADIGATKARTAARDAELAATQAKLAIVAWKIRARQLCKK